MKRRARRFLMWWTLTFGATAFQLLNPFYTGGFDFSGVNSPTTGCINFWSNGLLDSIDFCYVLDCENGWFGGAFDPCSGSGVGGGLLVDCPIDVDQNDININ